MWADPEWFVYQLEVQIILTLSLGCMTSTGLKKILTFSSRCQVANEILFQSPDGKFWSPVPVKFFVNSETHQKQSFKRLFRLKHYPNTRERTQKSDCHVQKGSK